MRISTSDLRRHFECPAKFSYEFFDKRVPLHAYQPSADVGILWHIANAELLKGANPILALAAAETEFNRWKKDLPVEYLDKVHKEWDSLALLLPHVDFSDLEVHRVEQKFSYRLYEGLDFVGTFDAIVRWKGLFWHLQHKTLSPSTPIDTYQWYMHSDWHECMYEHEGRKSFKPWGGTILNIARKLSRKSILENPYRALIRLPITRPEQVVEDAYNDFRAVAGKITAYPSYIKNRGSCCGPYKNRRCAYYDVCHGGASLADPVFKDAVDRYGPDSGLAPETVRETED